MREKRRSGEERSRGASDARVLVSDGTRDGEVEGWRWWSGGWMARCGWDGWMVLVAEWRSSRRTATPAWPRQRPVVEEG